MTDLTYTSIIWLTQGKYAIVDNEDYYSLIQMKWNISRGYAQNISHVGVFSGKRKLLNTKMHRLIMKTPSGMDTDHINGNRLDNRKSNLRICTHKQNQWNRKKNKGSSIYKGVSWNTKAEIWKAAIKVNGIDLYLGCFKCEKDAAAAYNKAATENFGEFAGLNIIH